MKLAAWVALGLVLASLAGSGLLPVPFPVTLDDRVQIFYYPWFTNLSKDGTWGMWGASGHRPPADIAPRFYPRLELYSSGDVATIRQHLQWIQRAHVSVIIYSWRGQGGFEDRNLPLFLNLSQEYGMKVALHVEPLDKGPEGYRTALVYFFDTYGSHPALYRRSGRPVVYFFAPYLTSISGWGRLLSPGGDLTIRGTPYDIVALAQATNTSFIDPLQGGSFDGMYMYDASGKTDLRLMLHWPYLSTFARSRGKIFIPTAGPGYNDTGIRAGDRSPWVVQRDGFNRYDFMWQMALSMDFVPDYVTVTSFNEWGEGTQIEPAVAHQGSLDYGSLDPMAYLDRTAHWVDVYRGMLEGHPLGANNLLAVGVAGATVLVPAAYWRRRHGAGVPGPRGEVLTVHDSTEHPSR